MSPGKVVDLIYPHDNLRHKSIPLPDFEKLHAQMIQMGKHADLSYLWIDYKKENPDGYQLSQFYKLYSNFMKDTYGTDRASMNIMVPPDSRDTDTGLFRHPYRCRTVGCRRTSMTRKGSVQG